MVKPAEHRYYAKSCFDIPIAAYQVSENTQDPCSRVKVFDGDRCKGISPLIKRAVLIWSNLFCRKGQRFALVLFVRSTTFIGCSLSLPPHPILNLHQVEAFLLFETSTKSVSKSSAPSSLSSVVSSSKSHQQQKPLYQVEMSSHQMIPSCLKKSLFYFPRPLPFPRVVQRIR